MREYVLSLAAPGACDPVRAGGKAARLAEMVQAGVRVPPGFVVSSDAWRELVWTGECRRRVEQALGQLSSSSRAGDLEDAARELRSVILEQPFPTELDAGVIAAYAQLSDDDLEEPAVAVRSSATLEDADLDSFAGQFETRLWVRGSRALLASIQDCWASMFSASGLGYAAHFGLAAVDDAMAVAVQKMVHARASGVMFTLDPKTGDPSVISIEGSWGLGSAVVGGEVTPDHFVVSKPTMAVSGQVRRKDVRHVPAGDSGIREEEVPVGLREVPCLSDEEAVELARIGRQLERHYGGPQDIEWSVDERLPFPENVLVVQCRPETVWSRRRREPALDPSAGTLGWITQTLKRGA
jgi:pyruvate, water dikinase